MSLYDILAANQRPTSFPHSPEEQFFNRYSYLLAEVELWSRFLKPADPFEVVRANIILRALLNKERIERHFLVKSKAGSSSEGDLSLEEYMRGSLSELPYLAYEGTKIYVPIFPVSLNLIYGDNFAKLGLPPYKRLIADFEAATVDPFDYYGYRLFDSYFTKLVAVRKTPKVMAAYDYDAECLYFIDDQGRLDAKIAFFDKKMPNPSKTHMIKRIERVADAYLADDRENLLRALVEESLVSSSLIHDILGKDLKYAAKTAEKETSK
jgi:hypothetical protein